MSAAGPTPVPTTVALLIVNYFSADQVAEMLRSVLANTSRPESLVLSIVDNSLSDDERRRLDALAADIGDRAGAVIVTAADENLGYGRGNNLALARARDAGRVDVAMVVNPDVVVTAGDVVEDAMHVAQDDDKVFSARTYLAGAVHEGRGALDLPTSRSRQLALGEAAGRRSLSYPAGHFVAMSERLWNESGGFDPDFFLYGEELDLVLRLRLDPDRIASLPSVEVAHVSGGTTGSAHGDKSTVTYMNATRSMVLLYRKHARLRRWLPIMLLSRVAFAIAALLRGRTAEARSIARGLYAGLLVRLTAPVGKEGANR